MQRSESRLRSGVSVRCGLALVCLFTSALGVAGAEEVVQSCGDLVEPQDGEVISLPAQVPGVYLACLSRIRRQAAIGSWTMGRQ